MQTISTKSEHWDKPKELNYKTVIYWDTENEKIVGSVLNKAKKFLKLGCVRELKNGYAVFPIPNYNKTTYYVIDETCNCQGFHKNKRCSHTLAVRLYKIIKNWRSK